MLGLSKTKKSAVILSAVLLGSFALIAQAAPEKKPESQTLKDLQTAYNGESNASVMYAAYAKKADEEGYKGVASLFRSASKAEAIHRDSLAQVIKSMGATPQNKINNPTVKTTKDNLENAVKGESYERDEMYPKFIKQAQKEGKKDAVQAFNYAVAAETQHAKLYKEALDNLNSWKQPKTFYVCSLSGATTLDAAKNPCTTPDGAKKPVEKIN